MNLKTIISTILFFCTTLGFAQVFQNEELTITKLEKDMWVFETSDNTTLYLIEGTKKALLIDTGTISKISKLDSIVGLLTAKPVVVLITHVHVDHAGNMNYFEDVYLHPADTVLLGRIPPYNGTTHYLADGDQFELGNKNIEVLHMPGHTPGSVVFIDREAGNCYSGDAFGSGQVWMQLQPHVSMAVYAESCRRMEKLMNEGITKIYCGHYPHVHGALGKTYMTDMRQLAEQLTAGTAPEGKDYPYKVSIGPDNPMITTLGSASIVYDPENIN
ncbi:MBL fold metallo-hydrolase [Mangrovibacterium diazotrophicum]|uniref:Glyoxylase-like metal-dependent hydrolase (Beta-lactamase superfamily II) n=1 Tax=Mangrovibacterium diazotrophicum TaxID=1261403 RepID=A0A419VYA5_9BACT|nr:MBL fold metallo-hydrolase [Mangrovibacterium diazotrophicum]RKD88186.1 glyoxylase-like metal-dependent hydrolase (beta-lactamase superfamily II) [Mangrovibacterium diazotrophicum]